MTPHSTPVQNYDSTEQMVVTTIAASRWLRSKFMFLATCPHVGPQRHFDSPHLLISPSHLCPFGRPAILPSLLAANYPAPHWPCCFKPSKKAPCNQDKASWEGKQWEEEAKNS